MLEIATLILASFRVVRMILYGTFGNANIYEDSDKTPYSEPVANIPQVQKYTTIFFKKFLKRKQSGQGLHCLLL